MVEVIDVEYIDHRLDPSTFHIFNTQLNIFAFQYLYGTLLATIFSGGSENTPSNFAIWDKFNEQNQSQSIKKHHIKNFLVQISYRFNAHFSWVSTILIAICLFKCFEPNWFVKVQLNHYLKRHLTSHLNVYNLILQYFLGKYLS